ncbi:hypothetical protein MTP10_34670, partial [Nonomuraea sp. 3-1Str]|uniref:hypothetical protein n=1 Tax=Nonomuraea sp. 3-1Str TaxID=2929801 RepID=UPI00285B53D1
ARPRRPRVPRRPPPRAVLGRGPRARRLRARLQVALAPFADALTEAPRVLAPERLARVETWTAAWVSRLVERLAGERDPVRAYALARMARFAGPLPAAVAAVAAVPRRSPFLDPAFAAWALRLPPNARYDAALPASHLRRAALVVSLVPRTARGALGSTPVPLKPAPGTGTAPVWEPERGFGVGAFPLCLDHGILAPGGGPVEPLVAARLAVLEGWLAGAGRVSR